MAGEDLRPMLINVTPFGTFHMLDTPTDRNVKLMAILKDEGGINMSVPPGKYLFNVFRGPSGMMLDLRPA